MRKSTFDTFKSTNLRLHNKLTQEDEYHGYLKRIDNIVDRKYHMDHSPDFYMTFLNKSRERSKHQKSIQREEVVQIQNKHLLQKIQKQKSRKALKNNSLYEVHMYQKRIRQQQRINQQNYKMASRIMHQNSYLMKNKLMKLDHVQSSPEKLTKERLTELQFFDSRLKNRKLPKLNSSSLYENKNQTDSKNQSFLR